MKINIHQTISNVFSEDRKLINTTNNETYVIYPDEGKLLHNKITGFTTAGFVCLGSEETVDDYDEIDKENA